EPGAEQLVDPRDRRIARQGLVDLGGEPRAARGRIDDAERRDCDAARSEPCARQQRVPREREASDDPGVSGDRGVGVADALVDAGEPVCALAALEGAALPGERVEPRARLVPLAEE